MGDLVLTSEEVSPVMQKLLEGDALPAHLLESDPAAERKTRLDGNTVQRDFQIGPR